MRHATLNVIITVTIDVLFLLLMGIGNMMCSCLTLTPMDATSVTWAIMTCHLLIQTILAILH